jgi:gas vesicle protein
MDNSLKYKIVEKIIQSNDENLLNEIKSLIGLSETDFWTEIPEEIKKSINKAKEELDRGEGLAYDDVMDEIKSRFLKQ